MKLQLIKQHPLLCGLIFLGISLRLWNFGALPLNLNRDEAALGYNAFAIGEYGQDEWGVSYPFVFKSFGDFKLPGYIYTLAPLVQILGTDDWVIRLPSLMAGLGLIPLTFIFTRSYFDRKTALQASVLVALAPWAIFYSRNAYEANLALFLLVVVLILLVKRFTWTRIGLLALTYFFATATYNTPLLLAPVLIVFALLQKQTLSKRVVKASVLFAVALLMARLLLPVNQQKQGITIFSDPTLTARQLSEYAEASTRIERLFSTRPVFYSKAVVSRFIESYLPNFLVFKGGAHPWHSLPGSGHIFLTMYGLSVIGGLVLWKRRVIQLWFLTFAAVLPAIITIDAPHATRSLLVLFLLTIIGASGWSYFERKISWLIPIALISHSLFFGYRLLILYPQTLPHPWPVGLRQAVQQTQKESLIIVAPKDDRSLNPRNEQAYIYILLEEKMSPRQFQETVHHLPADISGMIRVEKAGRYIITDAPQITAGAAMIELTEQGEYVVKK